MDNNTTIGFLDKLEQVVAADVAALKRAQKSYGTSWKKRGGVGAFMMLGRKWDRLENFLSNLSERFVGSTLKDKGISDYDIFAAIQLDTRGEGVIDDIRDLRRYLTLVEAEMIARGIVHQEVKKEEKFCEQPGCPLKFEHNHPKPNMGEASMLLLGDREIPPVVQTKNAGNCGIDNPRGFDPAQDIK